MKEKMTILLILAYAFMYIVASEGNVLPSMDHGRRGAVLTPLFRVRGGANEMPMPASRPATVAISPRATPKGTTLQQTSLKDLLGTDNKGDQQYSAEFMVRDRRIGFIRKVYSTLAVQLLFTGAMCVYAQQNRRQCISLLSSPLGNALYYLSIAGSIGTMIALSVSEKLRRTFPKNIAMLGFFTLCESVMVAAFTLFFKATSVWNALLQTGLATGALTAYAFQTNPKYDLTALGSGVFAAAWCMLGFGIITLFFRTPLTEALYSTFAALAISAFIIYDTQIIIGGKHRQRDQLDSKDYVLGSLMIYMDIISLFMHLLKLFGQKAE